MLTSENLQVVAASLFGVLFLSALLIVTWKFPNPTKFQQTVLRVVLALSAAGVAAMIPGFINLNVSAAQGLILRAGGAIAVFVIVYFFNPAERASEAGGSSSLPEWALKKDVVALKSELRKLPLSQRLILSTIAGSKTALRPSDLLENPRLGFTRREITYMCKELTDRSFVETRQYTDREYAISETVLKLLGKSATSFLVSLTSNEQIRPDK